MPDPAIHRRRWWILGVLIISLFTVNLDNTVLNIALPTLARELHADTSQLQWMVDAYVLVFAGFLLAAGGLGDRYGRRLVLLIGLTIFGVGSLLSAFAPSATVLIGLRAAMGLGGALIVPSTLAVTAHVFTLDERPKAIAIWTGVSGLGIVAGPVLAGWLLEHFAWGSIFLINVPVAIVSIAGTLALVPEARAADAPALDVPGTALSAGGLVALVYAIIEAPSAGWTSPAELVAFALAAILLTGFVWRELRTPDPLLDVRLFRSAPFSASALAITLSAFGLFGSMFFLSQYLQGVLGFGAMETGFSILPLAIALALFSPLSLTAARRIGTRSVVAAGLAAVALGLVALHAAGTSNGYPLVAATLFLVGGGMGAAGSPVTVFMIRTLPRAKQGIASAITSTGRELGGALGVAILGSISAPIYASGVAATAGRLPGAAGAAVSDSLAGAGAVAALLPGSQGAALLDLARSSFVDGMSAAVLVGAAVASLAAVVALAFLPGREPAAAVEPVPERVAAPAAGLTEAA